jgi:hypothetical protein
MRLVIGGGQSPEAGIPVTVCEWVKWCERDGEHHVEMSNRAGRERIVVCALHIRPALLHGYLEVQPGDPDLPPADESPVA